MTTKPIVLATFAANGLPAIQTEITKIKQAFQQQQNVDFKLLENATIETLANAVIEADSNLLMFHYGGHANQGGLFLENRGISGQPEVDLETGFYQLDKIRLSRLLVPIEKRGVQLVFLNGCLSYGHVGVLTAKGVRAIIATNVSVNDEEAARLSGYFYQLFFEKGFTLKQAFETAETTVRGKHSYPIIVNPGEIDENHVMPSSWTLFVNAQHLEVLNWILEDFLRARIIIKPFEALNLGALPRCNEGIDKILAALKKQGADIKDKNEGLKKKSVVIEFSWIVGDQLRKLFMKEFEVHNRQRLELLLNAYTAATRFIAYVLLSQMFEEKRNGKSEAKCLEWLGQLNDEKDSIKLNYYEVQLQCWKEMQKDGISLFISELEQTLRSISDDELTREKFNFIENIKNRFYANLPLGEEEATLSAKCEAILTDLLAHNAFMAKYRLVTIKDISVFYYRFQKPQFSHKVGELHDLYLDNYEDIQYALKLDQYAHSHSVILVRKDKEEEMYASENHLVVSPLIIDRSAYDANKSTPEIFYYAWAEKEARIYADYKYNTLEPGNGYFLRLTADNTQEALNIIYEQMQPFEML